MVKSIRDITPTGFTILFLLLLLLLLLQRVS